MSPFFPLSRCFIFFLSSSFHPLLKSPRVHKFLPRSVSACFLASLPKGRNWGQHGRAAGRVPGGGRTWGSAPRPEEPAEPAQGCIAGSAPAPGRGSRLDAHLVGAAAGAGGAAPGSCGGPGCARGQWHGARRNPARSGPSAKQPAEDNGASGWSPEACPPYICHLPRSSAPRHSYPAHFWHPPRPRRRKGAKLEIAWR